LRSVERSLADAQLEKLSPEGRFAAAYDALLRIATVALRASGYRTSPDRPGHHAITLQSLPLTLGIDPDLLAELDAFRRRRNLAAYEGDDSVSDRDVAELLATARKLSVRLSGWLATNHPGFA
jgi:hypothetical protein